MDISTSELWASFLSATKGRFALHSDRPLSLDDIEGDDDLRIEFSCPFCYLEFDIGTLCSHLEDEHCLESRTAVCPVCAAKVGTDVVGHITLQHGHLFKMERRRKQRKATNSASSLFSLVAVEESHIRSLCSTGQLDANLDSREERELNSEVAILKAKFMQGLVLSTIFTDD